MSEGATPPEIVLNPGEDSIGDGTWKAAKRREQRSARTEAPASIRCSVNVGTEQVIAATAPTEWEISEREISRG